MAIAYASDNVALLKSMYPDKPADYVVRQQSKWYNMVRKDTMFGGEDKKVVVPYGGGAGISGDYATALANAQATLEARFSVTHQPLYGISKIGGDVIARTLNDEMALVRALTYYTERAVDKWNRNLLAQIWSIGGGALTRFTATGTTVTNDYFTCDPISDVGNFEVGQKVTLSTSATSVAGLVDSGTTLTVEAVNYATGVVTFTAAINTVAGAANTNYVHLEGTLGKGITGIRGWVPITAPTAGDSHFGVDRSVAVNNLAGVRYDGSGKGHIDAIRQYYALVARMGITADAFFCSPIDHEKCESELLGKGWVDISGELTVGHRALMIETAAGPAKIISEPYCPQGYGFPLMMDEWSFETAGECPQYLDFDGVGKFLRSETSDSVNLRLGMYGNCFCNNPGKQGVVTFAAIS